MAGENQNITPEVPVSPTPNPTDPLDPLSDPSTESPTENQKPDRVERRLIGVFIILSMVGLGICFMMIMKGCSSDKPSDDSRSSSLEAVEEIDAIDLNEENPTATVALSPAGSKLIRLPIQRQFIIDWEGELYAIKFWDGSEWDSKKIDKIMKKKDGWMSTIPSCSFRLKGTGKATVSIETGGRKK